MKTLRIGIAIMVIVFLIILAIILIGNVKEVQENYRACQQHDFGSAKHTQCTECLRLDEKELVAKCLQEINGPTES